VSVHRFSFRDAGDQGRIGEARAVEITWLEVYLAFEGYLIREIRREKETLSGNSGEFAKSGPGGT
jgi:hypothetical protein